jgi:hypothetical protein
MRTTTIGDLITGLVDIYERRYEDHELATVKAALVLDDLLQARARRSGAGAKRAVRGAARKAA